VRDVIQEIFYRVDGEPAEGLGTAWPDPLEELHRGIEPEGHR
jgi:hypothetical protein